MSILNKLRSVFFTVIFLVFPATGIFAQDFNILDDFGDTGQWEILAPGGLQNVLSSGDKSMVFLYEFPQVTYGYGNRDSITALHRKVSVNFSCCPVWQIDINNKVNTEHMFYLRIADSDGTIYESRPFPLTWEGSWRTISVNLGDMKRIDPGKNEILDSPVTDVYLIIQQAMSGRLGSSGFYRKGEISFAGLRARDGTSLDCRRNLVEGRVYPPEKTASADKDMEVPLLILQKGKSSSYPIRTGIPFGQGMLNAVEHLKLYANNKEAEFQPKILSYWPDGSLKVVLVQFPADITGKTSYKLRIERRSSSALKQLPPLAVEKNNLITVDTGGMEAFFNKTGNTLIDGIALQDGNNKKKNIFSNSGLKTFMEDTDGTIITGFNDHAAIEENGHLFSVIKVTGAFSSNAGKNVYLYTARFYFTRGSKNFRSMFTFVNNSGETYKNYPRIWLENHWGEDYRVFHAGLNSPFSKNLSDNEFELYQGAAEYKNNRLIYPCSIKQNGQAVYDDQKFDGYLLLEGKNGRTTVGLFETWQNNPKKITFEKDRLQTYLSMPPENEEDSPRYYFYHGMAKTHFFMFDFENPDMVSDFLNEPLITAAPAWYCGTGVFGNFLPVDEEWFPVYEQSAEEWKYGLIDTDRMFGAQYGMRDFGDFWTDNPDFWWNLETSSDSVFIRQFLRTGKKEYFSIARQQSSHYADIDTYHAPDSPRYLGAVYSHRPNHVAMPDDLTKTQQNYLHSFIGGHNWYTGAINLYLLTGNEWLRDCAILHGDSSVYGIEENFKENIVLARDFAWPLKNLCSIYDITRDPKYLEASAKLVNFWHYWKGAMGTGKFGGGDIILSSLRDYCKTTNDPVAIHLFKEGGSYLLEGIRRMPGEKLPEFCLYYSDARVYLLDVFPDLYRLTGDERYIRDFVDFLYFFILNNIADPTIYWCSPPFLKAMKELGIKEPVKGHFLPVVTNFSKPPLTAEAVVLDDTDSDFTISVSRLTAFRFGHLGRGLIDGWWEGYVQQDGKRKESDPRLEVPHFGNVKITDPSGKTVIDEIIEKPYSKVYTYRIKKDGQKGIYKIVLTVVDELFSSFSVCTSLDRIATKANDHMLPVNPVYFYVPEDRDFTVGVQSRKRERQGGAILYSPDGSIADEIFWDRAGADKKHTLKGKGEGIWKLERSMFMRVNPLTIENIPDYISPSEKSVPGNIK